MRLFVDGLLQFGELSEEDREAISAALAASGRSLEDTLAEASTMLSGLSAAAGVVLAPKSDGALKHIEFVPLGSGRALVVLVNADGQVENRVIEIPPGVPPSALQQASNYLNARLSARPLAELRRAVAEEMALDRSQLDALSAQVVEAGLATWTGEGRGGSLIVRGQARLLSDVTQIENLAAIQRLFERLETQETMLRLLDLAERSDGVRIFIGSESGLFGSSGVAMVVAPARNSGGPHRGRHRRDRPDAHQLRPDHPGGGLHRARHRTPARLRPVAFTRWCAGARRVFLWLASASRGLSACACAVRPSWPPPFRPLPFLRLARRSRPAPPTWLRTAQSTI